MRRDGSLTLVGLLVAAWGCGSADNRGGIDGATMVSEPDAAAVVNPFVPAAVASVITKLAAECEAKGLTSIQKPAIAVMPKTLTGFFVPVVLGASRMSTQLGTVSVVESPYDSTIDKTAPDAAQKNAALQTEAVHGYIVNNLFKGLAIAPVVGTGDPVTMIDSFIASCGPVVTIDSDMPSSLRSYLIATSNYQAGVTAAKKLLEVVKPGESVLVFGTTLETWVSGLERAQGAIDTLTAAGVIVAPKVSPVWVPATDQQNLIIALSDPTYDFTGMACMYSNGYNCAAAVEALGLKEKIKIVGFDMEAPTKEYFDKGYFHAIAVQRQYYMGQLGVLVPYAINVLGAARTAELLRPILVNPTFIDTGIDLITNENYAAYMSFLSELGINA
jgi:ABC-type sugar transport system substrate-binding protein